MKRTPLAGKVKKEEPTDPILEERGTNQVVVICQSLYVRESPSKSADILFQVKKDDVLIRLYEVDTPDSWIKMIFNGKTGWVMKVFTEEV